MKKKLAKLLICIFMLGIVFSLGACESDDDKSNENETSNYSSNSEKMYSSIKEYVESDEFQNMLKKQMSSDKDASPSMEVKGEGNKLVFSYQYTKPLIDDTFTLEDARKLFDQAIEQTASTYTNICSKLPLIIDVKDPVVVLKYIDADGTLIWEKEFKSED